MTDDTLYSNALARHQQGQFVEAEALYRKILATDPGHADALNQLGQLCLELRRGEEAVELLRRAHDLRPGNITTLTNLGRAVATLGRLHEAAALLEDAVAADPRHAPAHQTLGTVLRDLDQLPAAIACLERAAALAPCDPQVHSLLGSTLHIAGRYEAAAASYDEALRLDPDLPHVRYARAMVRLRFGELAAGFAEHEWRLQCPGWRERQLAEPRWDGSPLDGRTILLYGEQGLGDTLQFVRFAADAKQRGGHTIVACQPPLLKILATCPDIDQLVPFGSSLPPFDVHAPLMSLPGILKLTEEQFWHGPYLAADPPLVDTWRRRLEKFPGYRVGICWQGNPAHQTNRQRSIPLSAFAPLAHVPGSRLVSLQKDASAEVLAAAGFPIVDLRPQFDLEDGAFQNAAAIIRSLDLVVTCDTAIAHLAGALGAEAWVALAAHSDWRWFLGREDSPWYPSVRLFRQHELGQWDDVFGRIAALLRPSVVAAQSSRHAKF